MLQKEARVTIEEVLLRIAQLRGSDRLRRNGAN
jgi:hypothetical protein